MEKNTDAASQKSRLKGAEIAAAILGNSRNDALLDTLSRLALQGVMISVLKRKEGDPSSMDVILPMERPFGFKQCALSALCFAVCSTEQTGSRMYKFTLDELRFVEKKKDGTCLFNLNNAVFFEASRSLYPLFSYVLTEYESGAYNKTLVQPSNWFSALQQALRDNGGMELIARMKDVVQRKDEAAAAQKYETATHLRDEEKRMLAELADILDQHAETVK